MVLTYWYPYIFLLILNLNDVLKSLNKTNKFLLININKYISKRLRKNLSFITQAKLSY